MFISKIYRKLKDNQMDQSSFLKDILKGIIIGVANIIPGVSGGTLAVSMGVYDKIISSITQFIKSPKKSIWTLLPYGIGAIIGIIALSFGIEWLFLHYPLQTNFFFIGLILGSVPIIYKNVKNKKVKGTYIFTFLIMFIGVVGLSFVKGSSAAQVQLAISIESFIKLFFVGVIASATMVIPGVSGSMVLTVMGYYLPIIETVNQCIKYLIKLDFISLFKTGIILVPFGIGVIIGVFLIAKLIELLFKKAKVLVYWGIMGLILGSPIAILLVSHIGSITLMSFLIGMFFLAVGIKIATMLSE